MSLVVESPPVPADSHVSARLSRGWRVWLSAAVLCWLVPVATHLLRIDAVLPVVIWLGTASLLRGGRTLLDRVMLAAGLLVGVVGVAGPPSSVGASGMQAETETVVRVTCRAGLSA